MRRFMALVEAEEKAHPFELAGLGLAPFKCVGVYSLPSPALAETNPAGYQNALREMPSGYGVGSCAYCGMGLVHNFLINSADGKRFVVGSECVAKTGDRGLSDAVKVKAAQIRREAHRAKEDAHRKARWEKYQAENADRLAAEAAEREAREAAIEAKKMRIRIKWEFLLPYLQGDGNFVSSMRDTIEAGNEPRGRAVQILADIYAKAHGRRGSKSYDEALDRFDSHIDPET